MIRDVNYGGPFVLNASGELEPYTGDTSAYTWVPMEMRVYYPNGEMLGALSKKAISGEIASVLVKHDPEDPSHDVWVKYRVAMTNANT